MDTASMLWCVINNLYCKGTDNVQDCTFVDLPDKALVIIWDL